jgi:acyl carrier protein
VKSVEQRVRSIIATITGYEPDSFSADTPLFRGGLELDSLSGVKLILSIEREFGVSIADEDLDLVSLYSVETLCRFISSVAKQSLWEVGVSDQP